MLSTLVKIYIGLLISLSGMPAWAAQQLDHPDYSGTQSCAGCHQQEYTDWQGSHHDLAMQHVTDNSVLGDFNNAKFTYKGITTTFYKNNGDFWVNTDGASGQLEDFKIEFVFGVDPLQQYLIGFDDGRLQALNIAWDSRPAEQGGQRWLHLYPNEQVHSADVLHWTRQSHNWNSQCAECHSTNLEKNYDAQADSYQTRFYEINVGCEACHGPGAKHHKWAQSGLDTQLPFKGFNRSLSVTAKWLMEQNQPTAKNQQMAKNATQITTCTHCHARRSMLDENPGKDLLDQHIPSLIQPGLYHADGQILDEVFVYGSFAQSKMYQQGVTCTNCHNPHSLEIKAPGNAVCAQCHNPQVFDIEQHHHHPKDSAGAMCVNCHMPETTYMVVDPRRDHSMRIPRPDLTKAVGAPNACNQCHSDQDVDWASAHYHRWYGDNLNRDHPAFAFHSANQNNPEESIYQLQNIAHDSDQALITRASALARMRVAPSQEVINSALLLLDDKESLVRFAAVGLFELLPPEQRTPILWPLLDDPVKAVRIEAARLLAGHKPADKAARQKLQDRIEEYKTAMAHSADSPAGAAQLGSLHLSTGDFAQAEAAYQHALKLEPLFIPARLNLADLYRISRQDSKAIALLEQGLNALPEQPDLNFSQGLAYIRRGDSQTAMAHLQIAAQQAPENARYVYVYAGGLNDKGETEQAISLLQQGLRQHPTDPNMLNAIIAYLNNSGRYQEALVYKNRL